MKTHVEVAVIGGGVVGASVLYHLTKAAGPRVPTHHRCTIAEIRAVQRSGCRKLHDRVSFARLDGAPAARALEWRLAQPNMQGFVPAMGTDLVSPVHDRQLEAFNSSALSNSPQRACVIGHSVDC